jgi:Tol biopolymer transport system component
MLTRFRLAPPVLEVFMAEIKRREFLAGAAGTAALVGIAGSVGQATAAPAPSRAGIPVQLRQGTDIAAQLSPDGMLIAMDAVGVLWVLPSSGGAARRLTSDLFDIAQPEWSPDSAQVAFQSYRAGNFDLWLIGSDGSGLRQLTHGPFDHREPRFSPDGRSLTFSSDASGSYGVYVMDLESGAISALADTAVEEYEPAWSPDGTRRASTSTPPTA